MVRLRVRYFSDGLVLGSKEFVESVFTKTARSLFPNAKMERDGSANLNHRFTRCDDCE
jgi:hypothetical protein